ncbi:MAG TPA: hypothetical protein VGR27_14320 [Longimicrobiaceae bacterium]|nr:hypothetical protein [Longimicrobiaceae bacterium]
MAERYEGAGGGADRPREELSPEAEANHTGGQMTIEDAIRLTARFDEEWFRSFETLEADLARFAAVFQLSPENARQVRKVVETLHEGEGGRGSEQEGRSATPRSYGSPGRSATAA